jgi:hypothetical protein
MWLSGVAIVSVNDGTFAGCLHDWLNTQRADAAWQCLIIAIGTGCMSLFVAAG